MNTSLLEDAATEPEDAAVPKLRQCLRCQTTFESAWSGERICTRCKGSHAWRQGSPIRSHPAGGG